MTIEQWFTPTKTAIVAGVLFVAAALPIIKNGLDVWSRLPRPQRLTVNADLTSLASEGNTLTVVNHSDKPALLGHWALVWAHGIPPWIAWGRQIEAEEEFGRGELTIPAHDRQRLNFVDGNWFDWGAKYKARGRLYLKLWPEGGKNARWFLVHTPGK